MLIKNDMKKQLMAYICGLTVLIVVFVVSLGLISLIASMSGVSPPVLKECGIAIFAAISSTIAGILAFLTARWCTRALLTRFQGTTYYPSRTLIKLIIVGYIITAVLGSPAVQSNNSTWAVNEYKRLKVENDARVWPSHPYIHTFASLPILPFVLLSYHEYQLDGLYGWGGWDIQLWYGAGVKRLIAIPLWVS